MENISVWFSTCRLAMAQNQWNGDDKYPLHVAKAKQDGSRRPKNNCEMLQAESVRDAAFGCDWVGTPIPFQRCLMFIIATANKAFQLTAGKFVPVSNLTTINVG